MSNAFDQIQQTDALWAFSSDGEFAEPIVYTKLVQSLPVTRTIYAVVVRDPPELVLDGQTLIPKMMIYLANNAETGIASDELDTGRDTLTVAYRIGTTAKAYNFERAPVPEDPAQLVLLVR